MYLLEQENLNGYEWTYRETTRYLYLKCPMGKNTIKFPPRTSTAGTAKDACVSRFKEWWTAEDLLRIIREINPDILRMLSSHGVNISNPDRLADILYDSVGVRFLRSMDSNSQKRRLFLRSILDTEITQNPSHKRRIIGAARHANPAKQDSIRTIEYVVDMAMTSKWCQRLAMELGLPPSVAEKDAVEHPPKKEIVEPHAPLNPLYDYQYSAGLFVRDMLTGEGVSGDKEIKRKLIALPTGSGKTRMIVEALVEWLNDGKPSKNQQQRDSKFILWIAQSGELCEQALSSFRSVFESTGRRGTTLHLHRFWGSGGSLPSLGMDDLLNEKGVIIATIQSLYKLLDRERAEQLEGLSKLTSCIIIDEAHHSVADSYSRVLRKMGFNWRRKEVSELGIILVGLTATPFRGSGDGEDTKMLVRRYGGVYFPVIPYSEGIENYKPHALIDCPTFALAKEHVRILGERSYDRDGFIADTDYSWTIRQTGTVGDGQNKWTFEKKKNITFQFSKIGEYEITLKVTDNEGDTCTTETRIKIGSPQREPRVSKLEKQKHLYGKLIKRKVLCYVYHHILQSERIELDSEDAKHMETFGEFRSNTLKEIGRRYSRNKMILEKIHELKMTGRRKILFFGCGVEHSRQIAMFLKMLYNMRVRYVDSKMDVDSRVSSIEQFRNGDLEVLCNFDVLTTGFDAPNVDCVFVGRPVKSTLLYTQMIGRGMRGTKSGGTDDVLIVDIDDNFQLADGDDSSIAEMGWKIFKDYWKPWENLQEKVESKDSVLAQAVPISRIWRKPQEEVESREPAAVLTYSCSGCGTLSEGIESIKKTFGIEGPSQILIEYLEAEKYDLLPSKCAKCRRAARDEQKPDMRYTRDVSIQTSSDEELKKPVSGRDEITYHADTIDKKFEYLAERVYGHIPTTRQFHESAGPEVIEIMNHLYGTYHEYVKAKGLSIRGDMSLEDRLYDEYFELYAETGSQIPKDRLDAYGDYRLADYVECFGTAEEFYAIADMLIQRMKALDPRVSANDLRSDYLRIMSEIGTEPHFAEVRTMSSLGVEYYTGLFGSLGRFKEKRRRSPGPRADLVRGSS